MYPGILLHLLYFPQFTRGLFRIYTKGGGAAKQRRQVKYFLGSGWDTTLNGSYFESFFFF